MAHAWIEFHIYLTSPKLFELVPFVPISISTLFELCSASLHNTAAELGATCKSTHIIHPYWQSFTKTIL